MDFMKMKSASFHSEFMFARAMHQTPDMIEPHKLKTCVPSEISRGAMRTKLEEVLNCINAAKMRKGGRLVETGWAKGQVVVEGFYGPQGSLSGASCLADIGFLFTLR